MLLRLSSASRATASCRRPSSPSIWPERLGPTAKAAIEGGEELAVASISWFERAGLAGHERILVSLPVRARLGQLSYRVRTVVNRLAVAATAKGFGAPSPATPGPADQSHRARAPLPADHQGKANADSPEVPGAPPFSRKVRGWTRFGSCTG